MSPMGTDEDAVEADLGSASMTRANDDGSAFVNDDPVATEAATWTSDVAELDEPDEFAELDEPAALAEPDKLAEPDEFAEPDEPAEQDELDEPSDEMDLAVDPLVTPPDMSQMLYVDVVLLLPATYPVVVLQEADPPFRELQIPVGGAEGIAIGYAARGLATPRPLTHELFTRVLEEFGMTLDVVRITEVRGTAFDAEMVISGRSGARLIDCRPSDAIALALRQQVPVPIMAASAVLEVAGTDPMGAN